MLEMYLKDNIFVLDKVSSWEEAIEIASQPLLEQGIITKEYVRAMIDNVHTNGAYMVIMPGIVLAHARPEHGVLNTGMTLFKLNKEIDFPEDKKADIVIVLAGKDSDSHLEASAELAEILVDDDIMYHLRQADDSSEIKEILFS